MIYTVTLNPAVDYVIQVPDFAEDKLNVTASEHKFPGGKGINVSRVLNQLEMESVNLGFIGGFTGRFIEEKLYEEKLGADFIAVQGDTRINIKLKSQVETEINGQGPQITATDISHLKNKLSQLRKQDLVVFSGSIPKGVSKDIYLELIHVVKQNEVPFVVDISSQELLNILPLKPILIKPNHHELATIFNTSFANFDEMIPYGEKLLEQGAQNVLLSMGKDGAALFTEVGIYRVNGLSGELKNSVGAGDSMVAGFISQLVQGKDLLTCFKYGVASGSATAFSDDLGSKEAILNLVNQITIKTIKEY
ncbi:1-phosphofructokinase [uncultured Vagococcus sp.]|uniref:1-phosphofructokinase n=1 Tax=uncultured Vagococcus sp. TaxID=189676 RepID=UPI00258BE126|nr:1-phosphofructokinase [uncultured Vagococcus sp.]